MARNTSKIVKGGVIFFLFFQHLHTEQKTFGFALEIKNSVKYLPRWSTSHKFWEEQSNFFGGEKKKKIVRFQQNKRNEKKWGWPTSRDCSTRRLLANWIGCGRWRSHGRSTGEKKKGGGCKGGSSARRQRPAPTLLNGRCRLDFSTHTHFKSEQIAPRFRYFLWFGGGMFSLCVLSRYRMWWLMINQWCWNPFGLVVCRCTIIIGERAKQTRLSRTSSSNVT